MKKLAATFLILALTTMGGVGMAFAGTLPTDSENEVKVYLTVPSATIDFTISEEITMTQKEGEAEMEITDLVIENNSTLGQIAVDELSLTASTGWTIEELDADFVNMAADSKKFSLGTGDYDFADGDITFEAADNKTVDAGEELKIEFSGSTCASSSAINKTQVGTLVATLGLN